MTDPKAMPIPEPRDVRTTEGEELEELEELKDGKDVEELEPSTAEPEDEAELESQGRRSGE